MDTEVIAQLAAAGIALGIYLLGIIMYVVQLIFMTEAWLAAEEIDVTAVTVARVLGGAWLGFGWVWKTRFSHMQDTLEETSIAAIATVCSPTRTAKTGAKVGKPLFAARPPC